MLRRLRIGLRLACIALSFGLPMTGALVYVVLRGVQKDIAFGASELEGTRYQRPLFALLVALAERPGPDTDVTLEKGLAELERVDVELGASLKTGPAELERRGRADSSLARLAEQRAELAKAPSEGDADLVRKKLAAGIHALLTHVGDSSNLILDPDLDSYYVMDVTNLALPELVLRLETIRGLVDAAAPASLGIESALRDEMLLLERTQLPRIAAGVRTALAEDEGFYGRSASLQASLPPLLEEFEARVAQLALAARASRESGDTAPLAVPLAGTLEAATHLWTTSVDELDRLIEIRIADYERSRGAALGVAAAAAAAASLLAAAIARSITRPLAAAAALAHRVAEGDLRSISDETSLSGSRDELAELERALHEMGAGLRRLLSQVEAAVGSVEEAVSALRGTSDEVGSHVTRQEHAAEEIAVTAGEVARAAEEVSANVDSLCTSTGRSAQSTQDLDSSVAHTAEQMDALTASLDEIASTISEMAASVRGIEARAVELLEASDTAVEAVSSLRASERDVGRHAEETRSIAERVAVEARQGESAVGETGEAIQGIRESFQRVEEVIGALAARSTAIGEVVSVIDGVAGETSLLSLNASIIAAQAGEQGRSFAIVADAIRGLADRTAGSSREIGEMLRAVRDDIERAVTAVVAGGESVERGSERSHGVGRALTGIIERCGDTAERAAEILRAGAAQSARLGEVERAFAAVRHGVHAIGTALQEHAKAGGEVLQTTDAVRELGEGVKALTVAQRADVSRAAGAISEVSERTRDVRSAVAGQREGCALIGSAAAGVRAGGQQTAAAATALREVLATLSERAARLSQEVDRFTL